MEQNQSDMDPLAKVLLAVALLLGASIVFEIAGFLMASARAEITVANALHPAGAVSADPGGGLTAARSLADKLKERNLFVSKPPKRHPVEVVMGILGGEVLIRDKWYKPGDSIEDAKIVAVGPTTVRILWDGHEKEFAPIAGPDSEGSPGPPSRRRPTGATGRARTMKPPAGPSASVGPTRGRSRDASLVSPEERARLKERWTNMTPEEREKSKELMRERFERRGR